MAGFFVACTKPDVFLIPLDVEDMTTSMQLALGDFIPRAREIESWIVDLRRTIHRHPELMYEEVETSKLVQETLTELSVSFQAPIAETGVLATIGNGDGPCVALRADMDALPIHEEADIDFRSKIDGKMHACGHDCHTAMLLGAARLLKEHESNISGTVKLIFQPAEEGGAGGKRMRDEGVLTNPDVQRIFGLHVWHLVETGNITGRGGTFLAATTCMEITVTGKGGHAALPYMTNDPVVTAAKIINEVQTMVSRETDPLTPLIVSITAIHGGEAFNVIPEEVKLRGTMRALSTEQIGEVKERLTGMVRQIATANRCEAVVEFHGHDYPATVNDDHLWNFASGIWSGEFGEQTVIESPPVMGGEDFSFFAEEVPGCFVGLGIRNEELGSIYSVHHPKFKVDESALPLGSSLHCAFAMKSLAELADGN